jgi:geranylgeranyl diphosphate synthase type II
VAILSGDTMFALAYRLMSAKRSGNLKDILDTFTRAAIEVCEGQQIDMDFETTADVTIPAYIEMIRLKTAVLLGASLRIGALSANADHDQADLLYDFGIYAGLAFQLQDDLLDAFASNEKFGKSIGGDILANKKTFLYLKCLEIASETDKKVLSGLFSGTLNYDPEIKILRVLELYNRYNIRQLATIEMERFFNKAIECLTLVNADKNKKIQLQHYAEWLYKRDY